MRKTIKFNKIVIIAIIIIILLLGYYIYYKNSNIYKEFEYSSELEELLPYEPEVQENQEIEETETNDEIIIVHITGEVKNWGVIELKKGARIIDAVNKAGGFTDDADVEKVNLAYVLTDGVKVYIPSKTIENTTFVDREYITVESGNNVVMGESEMKKNSSTLININEATQTELETLPGIGPSTALKIISYREEEGKFSTIEDIKNVSGIGENKFENIKELICI